MGFCTPHSAEAEAAPLEAVKHHELCECHCGCDVGRE